jgi:hypothetical protein
MDFVIDEREIVILDDALPGAGLFEKIDHAGVAPRAWFDIEVHQAHDLHLGSRLFRAHQRFFDKNLRIAQLSPAGQSKNFHV